VCVNSKATESACISIYKREYTVIPMGVDFEIFKPVKRSTQLANRYKLSEFTILFVGRLVEVKGVEYLIEALSKLSKDEIHFKALIVGDGPLKPELESYVANNDLNSKVEFCGWVDKSKLEEYYSVADVFVGPSLQEAQGIVFVEALATGTPVVASRVGGIIDIVTEGKNGYLVPAKSSRLLYEKLKLIIDDKDLLKKLSKSSRQEAKKKFSWDVVSEKYIKILSGGNKL
jgi:glycosyltransferase involved in cell wall biosynthesis